MIFSRHVRIRDDADLSPSAFVQAQDQEETEYYTEEHFT